MALKAHVEKCPSSTPTEAGGTGVAHIKQKQIMRRILEVPSAP